MAHAVSVEKKLINYSRNAILCTAEHSGHKNKLLYKYSDPLHSMEWQRRQLPLRYL